MIRNFISKLYSLYTPSFFISGGGSASGYVIERSLRVSKALSNTLRRTFGTPTNVNVWTLSAWIKRGELGTQQVIFGENAGNGWYAWFNTSNQIQVVFNGVVLFTSTAVFRDPSAHFHFVWSLNGTTNKVYINGVQLGSNFTGTNNRLNSAILHGLFCFSASNETLDGYPSEVIFVDGQELTPSSFGEINPTTGQWVAKKYTGTYGTNGFYLDFKDGTSTTTLGDDKSGNNNDWTLTNFTRSAGVNDCWMLDVPAGNGSASAVQPSGNYAVLNPLSNAVAPSAGNLTMAASTGNYSGLTTITLSSGKWYWECVNNGGSTFPMFGVARNSLANSTGFWTSSLGYAYYYDGTKYNAGSPISYGASFTLNDVIGVAFDADAGTLTFYKNGVSQGVAFTGLTQGDFCPAIGQGSSVLCINSVNFGQRSLAYTPPTGFKALCTANLPTPSIKKPSEHFDIKLSTGANIKTDAEALFTNELEWIKDRANADNHQLIDSVRGSNAVLQSNTTAAETTYTAPSGSSVGWVWRASDSAAVTNSVGSISSQVSANPTAGFSIVTYTGNGVNATVGHGLGVAPKMVIVKSRNPSTVGAATSSWVVYHAGLTSASYAIYLNLTNSQQLDTTFWNASPPASSVFSIGTTGLVNENTKTFVAYCFAEIAGYSKFGSYTGNGSADGPFVHCGFRPRFVMFKRTDAASAWVIYDASRDADNPADLYIQAQATAAEASAVTVDLNSNGFKIRTSGDPNVSGGTYIYMAFAESPFKYANAR